MIERIVRHKNGLYRVNRMTSSGLGDQYWIFYKDGSGSEKSVFISDGTVAQHPEWQELFEACRRAFEPRNTLGQIRQFKDA